MRHRRAVPPVPAGNRCGTTSGPRSSNGRTRRSLTCSAACSSSIRDGAGGLSGLRGHPRSTSVLPTSCRERCGRVPGKACASGKGERPFSFASKKPPWTAPIGLRNRSLAEKTASLVATPGDSYRQGRSRPAPSRGAPLREGVQPRPHRIPDRACSWHRPGLPSRPDGRPNDAVAQGWRRR